MAANIISPRMNTMHKSFLTSQLYFASRRFHASFPIPLKSRSFAPKVPPQNDTLRSGALSCSSQLRVQSHIADTFASASDTMALLMCPVSPMLELEQHLWALLSAVCQIVEEQPPNNTAQRCRRHAVPSVPRQPSPNFSSAKT